MNTPLQAIPGFALSSFYLRLRKDEVREEAVQTYRVCVRSVGSVEYLDILSL